MRQGTSFWEMLEEHGVPTTIFRMPVNFPPDSPGRSLSGMGTPDFLGTQGGTFTVFTTSPPANAADITGGRFSRVAVVNHRMEARLEGPDNPFRRLEVPSPGGGEPVYESPKLAVDFEAFVDPEEAVVMLVVQDQEFILQQGEWSDWIRLDFEAIPYLVSVSATAASISRKCGPTSSSTCHPCRSTPKIRPWPFRLRMTGRRSCPEAGLLPHSGTA